MRRLALLTALSLTGLAVCTTALGGSAASSAGALVKPAFNKKLKAKILVDGRGRTLYMWTADTGGKSNCTPEFLNCPKLWPPLITTGAPRAGKGVAAGKLSTFERRDGKQQVVYNRHPLYTYSEDKKPGDVKGQKYLGTWFVLSPKGTPIRK
jgi:predicted lipoprotein with Yx(FWY)xxD motif